MPAGLLNRIAITQATLFPFIQAMLYTVMALNTVDQAYAAGHACQIVRFTHAKV